MEHYSRKLTNRTWYYLNNTKIYGHENIHAADRRKASEFVAEALANWLDHAVPFLRKCNHSAIIMPRVHAMIAYANLSSAKVTLFYGKDIIYENIRGYTYFGQMPEIIHSRTKHFFQSDILAYWQKWLDYLLVSRILWNQSENFDKNFVSGRKSNTAANVLLFIPSIGLVASFVVFLLKKFTKISK